SSSSGSRRSERTGSMQGSDGIREADEIQEAEIRGDEATPAEQQGGGGCCKAFDKTKQVLKAGLTQAVSTALTFGTKPLIEATVLSVSSLTPVGASSLAATLTASLVGGAYAGIIHTAVSGAVSGLMN